MSQQTPAPTFRQRWLARTSWLAFLAHDLEKAVQAQRMDSLAEAGVPDVIARRLPNLPHTRRFWFGLAAFAFVAQVTVHRWARRGGLAGMPCGSCSGCEPPTQHGTPAGRWLSDVTPPAPACRPLP